MSMMKQLRCRQVSDVLWKVFDSKVADSVNARVGRTDAMKESRQYFEEHLIPRGNNPFKVHGTREWADATPISFKIEYYII